MTTTATDKTPRPTQEHLGRKFAWVKNIGNKGIKESDHQYGTRIGLELAGSGGVGPASTFLLGQPRVLTVLVGTIHATHINQTQQGLYRDVETLRAAGIDPEFM